jgi:predicted nucleic-acid-binding protein
MRAVDTNVLVRLITQDDSSQAQTAADFVKAGAWVSHIVLVETIWVLRSVYNLNHTRIQAVIETLLNNVNLSVQDTEVVTEALEEYSRHPKLGFSDCLIVQIARRAGHEPVGTFDKSLSKLTGTQRLAK